jgi:dethiobiotin synthetase
MNSLFVTASGTDIGKTWVCCELIRAWQSNLKLRCIKPVVSGFDPAHPESTDTARLLEAQHLPLDQDRIEATSPWRFRAALSADMAAKREDRSLALEEIVAFSRPPTGVDLNLIEGIGGVMAPIGGPHSVVDWIQALDTAVLLVVGSYLGSLSHSLTAVDALSRRDRRPVAIAISESPVQPVPAEESAASLERYLGDLPIVVLPRNDAAAAALLAARLERCLFPR